MKKYEFHEIANLFPMMDDVTFNELIKSIENNGLDLPIILYQGKILDGRNRFKACELLNIEPKIDFFTTAFGDDPLSFVVRMNLHRRHLNESQRSLIADKIAGLPRGVRSDRVDTSIDVSTQDQAATMMNVSVPSVQRARQVNTKGTPDLVKMVEDGKVAVSTASEVAQLPKEQQNEIVAKGEKEILAAAKEIRADRAKKKKKDRIEKLEKTEWPTGKYRVIYADPPWEYSNSGNTENYGHAAKHYETMPLEEICKLDVDSISLKDSVLFLWTTSPMLEDAFDVINSWGFKYKTSFIWNKLSHNWGYYNSVQHEILLVCVKGSCQPDIDERINSVIEIKKTKEHSEKPKEFRAIIDMLYPHGPRIELFSRADVDGWDRYGNERIGL